MHLYLCRILAKGKIGAFGEFEIQLWVALLGFVRSESESVLTCQVMFIYVYIKVSPLNFIGQQFLMIMRIEMAHGCCSVGP